MSKVFLFVLLGFLALGAGCTFLSKLVGITPRISGSNTILSTNTITIP